ncbi:uncharacterized protein LOC127811111 [Diospyros lotus]|uniref:uncharacterized protein LOC127811111 n=1 Tax=Diospyros lotus TaxID=55363 RepID=UPI00224E6405|nr:uncharacterized protein LOC127811111 [Diospyros lotus]
MGLSLNSTTQKLSKFSGDNFVYSLCKVLGISGLAFFLVYLLVLNHYSTCPASDILSPLYRIWTTPAPNSEVREKFATATNINHLVFGLVTSVKTWKPRRPFIEAWWRPNITRGFLFLDKAPTDELLPWPVTSPPFVISDDTRKLEVESKHVAPIMVRMVHAIWETFREGGEGVRWYIMGFDDSVFMPENWVHVLSKYDHTKYYYIGGYSETSISNLWYSFEQAFGGGGFALSYPLAAAMVKDLEGCIRRYPYVRSHDTIVQYCVNELGVSLTVEPGVHQIDLVGDISGFLSAHPQSPLLSLHHLDYTNPIFPSMDVFQSTTHLMKAGNVDQSRLLQQTICYDKQKKWSISVSWGYSVHIYEIIHPRAMLKRPLETFEPWPRNAKPPKFMFNTRWPCETPSVFFFGSIEKTSDNLTLTTYARAPSPGKPNCQWKGNQTAAHITKVQVFSSATKLSGVERSECCDITSMAGTDVAEVTLRACKDDEIIG